jgi:hypothetical protein
VDCPHGLASDPARSAYVQQIIARYSAGATAQTVGHCQVWLHR